MASPKPTDSPDRRKKAPSRLEVVPRESWASSSGVRRSMQSNHRDTRLELDLRSALHRMGLRFRIHKRPIKDLRCEADLVFRRLRVAIFLDGCFWHGCPIHATYPVAHGDWWAIKLAGNIRRDRRNDQLLADAGWTVMRLWEHQSIDGMAAAVKEAINKASLHLAGMRRPIET